MKLLVYHLIITLLSHFVEANMKDFMIVFEKMEVGFQDPEVLYENVTCRKYNRTTVATTTYEELYKPMISGEVKVKMTAFQFLSNTYRLTSVQFEYDYCTVLYLGSFGTKDFKKNSNYPATCPIPAGNYYIKDGVVSTDVSKYFSTMTSMPPNFMGKWKLEMAYWMKGNKFLSYDWYVDIRKKPKW